MILWVDGIMMFLRLWSCNIKNTKKNCNHRTNHHIEIEQKYAKWYVSNFESSHSPSFCTQTKLMHVAFARIFTSVPHGTLNWGCAIYGRDRWSISLVANEHMITKLSAHQMLLPKAWTFHFFGELGRIWPFQDEDPTPKKIKTTQVKMNLRLNNETKGFFFERKKVIRLFQPKKIH